MADGGGAGLGARVLERVLAVARTRLPPDIDLAYFDGFVERNHGALLALIEAEVVPLLQGRPASPAAPLTDPAARAEANLAAMTILAAKSGGFTGAERARLALYSGWGGIGLRRYAARFPTGFPVPEARGLVHEYYTPARVWEAAARLISPLRAALPREDGVVRALEPSAGIGRALAAFADWGLRFTALESSAVSARLLRALYPAAEVFEGYAEKWLAEHPADRFGLVLANPPYGPRGEGRELDPDGYKTAQAYLYFTIRTAERLAKGGVGVYIVPTGLLTSRAAAFVAHRQELLRRAHLLGAFRLPSTPPPGGSVADVAYDQFVVDVIVVQGRGGIAEAPPPDDLGVVSGDYYAAHPDHILGKELRDPAGEEADAPPTGARVRRGYQVQGRFTGFPPCTPRPLVEVPVQAVRVRTPARGGLARAAVTDALPAEAPERLRLAVALGARVDRFLANVARGLDAREAGHTELVGDLSAWAATNGAPARDAALVHLASGNVAAQRFVSVFSGATLLPAVAVAPPPPTYAGGRSLPELADWTFRQRGGLPLPLSILSRAAASAGLGPVGVDRALEELWPLGWRLDGDDLEPVDHYLSGFLWPKFDRAVGARHPRAEAQADELRSRIGWKGGADVLRQTAPNQPWIPLDLLAAWARDTIEGWPRRPLARVDGILTFEGVPYANLENTEKGRAATGASQAMLCLLGYINTDNQLWKPPIQKRLNESGNEVQVPIEETRREQEAGWRKSWIAWLQEHDAALEQLEQAYNRRLRGYVPPTWSRDPIEIARWNPAVKLHPYQNAGARKILANRCGLLAFDVGLGKTFTGIATLARARQEGWARRPVVVVPPTICWKWARDFARCLPDYRVVVIGSNRKIAESGSRKGKWISVNDTPEERAAKWTAFQAGAYDVAIVTYSALARQQIDREFVGEYVAKTVAIRRAITLALEQADADAGSKQKGGKRSERSEADLAERARAWLGDKLTLPKGWRYDPGIDWHQLGVDLLLVDEAQNFKNLFFSVREGSADRAAAKRAWALDFRCASVRAHSGGAGVVLLSATPMKNAATEFYNLLHLVNPAVWEQVGIADPESFISQFASIQERNVTQGDGSTAKQQVVTGFNHVEALKGVVFRWAEFKNAVEVGLKLPAVRRVQHVVRASAEQEDRFGELFGELAAIQEKISNVFKMGGNKADPKTAAILRALRMKKQGVNARLYLTALHPGLTGGTDTPEAGPKLVECVKTVVASRTSACSTLSTGESWCLDCGHLIFVENPLVHRHLRTLLVRAGIPRDRIAVLNAEEAADLELRQQIAEGFNGVGDPTDEEHTPPRFDVVIANAVAYEGIDLQRRTCAIHHLDVPWEPATLQQRNGRGVRQGNRFDDVALHFYFVAGSSEQHRLDKIERKRGILLALYDEGDLATNSVTADEVEAEDDDVADAFLAFAPPQLRERLEVAAREEKARNAEAQDDLARTAANAVLRDGIQARRRWLKSEGNARAEQLERDYRALEARIGTFPARLWPGPWHRLARVALETGEAFVPERGLPLVAGTLLHVAGDRAAESETWTRLVTAASSSGAWATPLSGHVGPELLDPDAQIRDAAAERPDPAWFATRFPDYLPFRSLYDWRGEEWAGHGPAWQASIWPRLVAWLTRYRQYPGRPLPALNGGVLVLSRHDRELDVPLERLVPPTPEGWQRFLAAARAQSTLRHTALAAVAAHWWGRELPLGTVGADLQAERAA